MQRLMNWAQMAADPLRAYATGLLMGAMEVQDIAANFKDTNAQLVSATWCYVDRETCCIHLLGQRNS